MSQATFVKLDAVTQGNWSGIYGGDGYVIPEVTSSLPSYAAFALQNDWLAEWLPNTTDVRALSLNGVRAVTAWYNSTSFSFTVNITDGSTRQVAIYCMDWDNYQNGRVQIIQVKDTNTGAVYDARTLSAFENGVWAVYTVTGSVTFIFTTVNGNAVVSGVMFAPTPGGGSPPIPATSVVSAPGYTVITVTTPAAPAHSAVLGWAPVSGASGYNVYRGTISGGPYTLLTASPVSAPAYQDLAIVAGTTYYYATTAIVNGVESGYSVQVPVTIPTP